jgi:hypothetical protein
LGVVPSPNPAAIFDHVDFFDRNAILLKGHHDNVANACLLVRTSDFELSQA